MESRVSRVLARPTESCQSAISFPRSTIFVFHLARLFSRCSFLSSPGTERHTVPLPRFTIHRGMFSERSSAPHISVFWLAAVDDAIGAALAAAVADTAAAFVVASTLAAWLPSSRSPRCFHRGKVTAGSLRSDLISLLGEGRRFSIGERTSFRGRSDKNRDFFGLSSRAGVIVVASVARQRTQFRLQAMIITLRNVISNLHSCSRSRVANLHR